MPLRLASPRFVALVLIAGFLLPGFLAPMPVHAQEMVSYYEESALLSAPASAFREGLLGAANPALPGVTGNHLVVAWQSLGDDLSSVGTWGVFSTLGGLGTSVLRTQAGPFATTRYHVSLAAGGDRGAFGVGYQGYTGDATALGRFNRVALGGIVRPVRFLSVGLTGNLSVENTEREVVGTVGLRPLGTERLTLFADAAWGEGEALRNSPWSAGAAVEVVRGIDVLGRVFEDESFSLGLRLELGHAGLGSSARRTNDGYAGQVSRIRLGSYAPSRLAERIRRGKERIDADLGRLPYRASGLAEWTGSAQRFYPVLQTLDDAAANPRIRTVALDLADLQVGPEKAWELRRAIARVQAQGKTVTAFLRNPGMNTYHVASRADRVVMDPQGTLILPGFAASRTFLAGTLEKLGLGFQEWRFFEYKSAAEALSRRGFSEADSLQRAQYVDDLYATFQTDVATARGLSADSLDRLVDDVTVFSARDARQAGLVDTLARWHAREDLLAETAGRETRAIDADRLARIQQATRQWGPRPTVAVVYAIGGTQLDTGIEARTLSRTLRDLAGNDDVDALVFRVDSPGGSGLASDLVAEALKEVAAKKPVIVSQGQVAGSGGYWISMYGDRILAGPTTVTGSIGVIGGWLYDDGFSDKTGLAYDVVQRGERADLFTGYSLPFVGGPGLPTRPLSEDELDRIEMLFADAYTQFVQKVAAGRDTTEAHIREVGEGRIYSGLDGAAVGLVDEIGGLQDAVRRARQAAGLAGDDAVRVVEINPTTGFFDLSLLLPGPLARWLLSADPADETIDPTEAYLQAVRDHQPGPMFWVPVHGLPVW